MAGEQTSRSRTTRYKGAATKAAEKKERARHHAETSKDISRAGDGSQERPSRGGEHAELAELESLSLDGMPDQLNKNLNKGFIHGLVELLDNPQVQGVIVAIPKGGSDKYGVSNPQGAKGKINIISSPMCH